MIIIWIWILSFLLVGSTVNNFCLFRQNAELKEFLDIWKEMCNNSLDSQFKAINNIHEKINRILLKLNETSIIEEDFPF